MCVLDDCIGRVKSVGMQSLWSVIRSDARGKLEAAQIFIKEMPGKTAWQGHVCHAKQAECMVGWTALRLLQQAAHHCKGLNSLLACPAAGARLGKGSADRLRPGPAALLTGTWLTSTRPALQLEHWQRVPLEDFVLFFAFGPGHQEESSSSIVLHICCTAADGWQGVPVRAAC